MNDREFREIEKRWGEKLAERRRVEAAYAAAHPETVVAAAVVREAERTTVIDYILGGIGIVFYSMLYVVGFAVSLVFKTVFCFILGMTVSKAVRTVGRGVGKGVDIWRRL